MVPAWHEREVIYAMLATNSRLLAYKNYQYFIGVYQNDMATLSEVRRAQGSVPPMFISQWSRATVRPVKPTA